MIRRCVVIFLEAQTIEYFNKAKKPKSDVISYTDVVPKPPSGNFVDGGDMQVNDENITNHQEPYHDDLVE